MICEMESGCHGDGERGLKERVDRHRDLLVIFFFHQVMSETSVSSPRGLSFTLGETWNRSTPCSLRSLFCSFDEANDCRHSESHHLCGIVARPVREIAAKTQLLSPSSTPASPSSPSLSELRCVRVCVYSWGKPPAHVEDRGWYLLSF